MKEKTTQPPKSHTEGTLLKAMETAGKSIEDDELKEAMKDTGLGTPATRAATIERLKQVGYILLSGKKLEITPKGCAAIELIRDAGVELLASPEMTGRWEQRLHQISKGAASDIEFMDKIKQFAKLIVDKVRTQRPAPPSLFQEDENRRKGGSRAQSQGSRRGSRAASAPGTVKSSTAAKVPPAARTSRSGELPEPAAPRTHDHLAPCPRTGCKGHIIEGKRGFGCSDYRDGCTFVIWKAMNEKKITASMAKQLATKGTTGKLSFKLSSGAVRKGRIVLQDPERGQVTVRYEE